MQSRIVQTSRRLLLPLRQRKIDMKQRGFAKAVRMPEKLQNKSFKEQWLSDAGTYPIIVATGCATCLVLYEWQHALRAPNVTIVKGTRGSLNFVENDLEADTKWENLGNVFEGKWRGPKPRHGPLM
jgi:hypothetical protein